MVLRKNIRRRKSKIKSKSKDQKKLIELKKKEIQEDQGVMISFFLLIEI